LGVGLFLYLQKPTATNFEECAKIKGSVVLQTYPRQCRAPDGETFTEEIETTYYGEPFEGVLEFSEGSYYTKEEEIGKTEEEVFTFLDDRNERQITFFEILAEKGEVSITNVVNESRKRLDEHEFKGLTLAGVLGGIGIRTNRMNKEPLYETSWKLDKLHYKLNDEYASFVMEWLKARKS